MNGLLVIDKPGGITSRDAVNRVQRWFPKGTRIGHTGTLDPLATGVLVVCIGAATRLATYVQNMGKTYVARVRLGARSTTDDADGIITPTADATIPTTDELAAALASFIGPLTQTPPAVSAVKVAGRRAHALVRAGEEVALAARTVHVYGVRLLSYGPPYATVEVDCGKGTYIRSISRDLGDRLGCGGLVETLRRTRVGTFRAEHGVSLDHDPTTVVARLRPMAEAVADLPRVVVDADTARRIRFGQRVGVDAPRNEETFAVFDGGGGLVAVGPLDAGGRFVPAAVLPS